MKKMICNLLYGIIMVVLPMIFARNGMGVYTWQWWILFCGIAISNLVGRIGGW